MESKVIVLILGYKSIDYLEEAIPSLLDQSYKNYEVWFADNNSKDGSVEYLNKKFPKIKTFQFDKNGGYAGGNNRLMKMAFEKRAEFSLVLNADTKSDKHLISNLVDTYQNQSKHNKVGLVQPVVMLYDKPNKINSIGNVIHYLGFGYCGGYMSEKIPKTDKDIISVSGTAMLISKKYYQDVGLFDEDFFMYNEDQDYSWRGLMVDYKHIVSVKSKIWHKYSFSKNKDKWYHSEKNRLMMIYKNYENKTLLKLIPILIFNEIAMLVYSLFDGWFTQKIKSYSYLYKNKVNIKRKKKEIQLMRSIDDDRIVKTFESKLNFIEVKNVFIQYIVNPLFLFYKIFV